MRIFEMRFLLLFGSLLFVFNCATSNHIRPMVVGENSVSIAMGGPLMNNLGAPVPAAGVTVNYLRGITPKYATGSSLNLVALFFGFLSLDSVHVYRIFEQKEKRPSLISVGTLHLMTDFKNSVLFFPDTGLSTAWKIRDKHYIYIGGSLWWNLYPERSAGLKNENWVIPQIYVGGSFKIKKWELMTELKWLSPWTDNRPSAVNYIGIGHYGALAPYISIARRWK